MPFLSCFSHRLKTSMSLIRRQKPKHTTEHIAKMQEQFHANRNACSFRQTFIKVDSFIFVFAILDIFFLSIDCNQFDKLEINYSWKFIISTRDRIFFLLLPPALSCNWNMTFARNSLWQFSRCFMINCNIFRHVGPFFSIVPTSIRWSRPNSKAIKCNTHWIISHCGRHLRYQFMIMIGCRPARFIAQNNGLLIKWFQSICSKWSRHCFSIAFFARRCYLLAILLNCPLQTLITYEL